MHPQHATRNTHTHADSSRLTPRPRTRQRRDTSRSESSCPAANPQKSASCRRFPRWCRLCASQPVPRSVRAPQSASPETCKKPRGVVLTFKRFQTPTTLFKHLPTPESGVQTLATTTVQTVFKRSHHCSNRCSNGCSNGCSDLEFESILSGSIQAQHSSFRPPK